MQPIITLQVPIDAYSNTLQPIPNITIILDLQVLCRPQKFQCLNKWVLLGNYSIEFSRSKD